MCQVNVFRAKTDFSKLLAMLENGSEDEIVIARDGKPVARLVLLEKKDARRRIGAAKGRFYAPDDLDADNERIEALFGGGR